ncbi:MAG: zinc-dependent alcohol dehydrogenase [Limisphaerales bacterium]
MPAKPTSPCGETMLAARLHGPSDLRVERIPIPGAPGRGAVRLRVKVTGICGSDLHSYTDARIGDTVVSSPLVLGHEFAGVIEEIGPETLDGQHQLLVPGCRVAVDPAQPCGHCELCDQGHPNLCLHMPFCGNHPYGGSLGEWMNMPGRSCFPLPDSIDDETGALLEPLGVAVHAIDLARVRVGRSVAILGAGPIGLLLVQMARLSGADPVFVADPLPWRLSLAERFGGVPIQGVPEDSVDWLRRATHGRGVDIAIEAAWGGDSVAQAVEMCSLGGRVVLVGIPSDDRLSMKHSTARRKGLTIVLSRRMKHCYPRAIRLAAEGRVDLSSLISHRFRLDEAPDAFALNAAYKDQVVKVMISS